MKPWARIIISVVIALVFIFESVYVFLIFQGKSLIIRQLEASTHKKVTISSFDITPPFNIQIKGLNIHGFLKVESMRLVPSILGFLSGNFGFNEVALVKPLLAYEKTVPLAVKPDAAAAAPKALPRLFFQPRMTFFKHLNIKDGRIEFYDYTVGKTGIKITVNEINFDLNNIYTFPQSVFIRFHLKGRIPWQNGLEDGAIEVEGWVDPIKRDMQATLKIKDIDGVYLYPYYSQWVDLEKARIEKAKLNFSSDIQGLNDNVAAVCHLELTDIVRKERSADESMAKEDRITDAVLDVFRALDQGRIILDFTIKTKMSRPEFGFGAIRMAFEDKIRVRGGVKDLLAFPADLFQGVVRGAADLSKAVFEGTAAIGSQIKGVFEGAFRK